MLRKKDNLLGLLNPCKPIENIYNNKDLLKQLAKQNVLGRYKGSGLGGLWSFVTPLFMLTIYTFVFSVIFKARWGTAVGNSRLEFALTIFCGLAVYNIFSESINSSATTIVSNVNYVKKVVFPLEILPVNMVMSALFFGGIWFIILFAGIGIFMHKICLTAICLPLILLPLILFTLGLSWFIASLGVYIRDVVHFIGLALQALFFMTPIFYPITMVPEQYQTILRLNPMTTIIQETRKVILYNKWPDWQLLGIVFIVSLVIFQLGYAWFMTTKRGFADVL
jgi:lipopolysaccharide transport system permease protein